MSELNLIQGDANHVLRGLKIAAQAFNPTYDHLLEFVDLQLRLGSFMTTVFVGIYYADGAHEPFGDCLTRNRYIIDKPWSAMAINRFRFSMQSYSLDADTEYVMVVRASIPMLEPDVWWRYHTPPSTYLRGHRLFSDNGGADWTHKGGEDFIFGEFGTPPSPPPPPDPPIHKNMPVDLAKVEVDTGFTIVYTTNVPCHLYMRWTLVPPLKHTKPRLQRGVWVFSDIRQCFVAWHDNEQEEAGDTLIHTFTKEWPICETRYYYFYGKCDNNVICSTSPIFTLHRTHEEPPPIPVMELIFLEPWSSWTPPPPPMEQVFIEPWTD